MSLYSEVESAISDVTSQPFRIVDRTPIGGGCISESECLVGEDRRFFLKQNAESFLIHFEEEKASLEELAANGSVRVPKPICSGAAHGRSYLVLEYIPKGRPSRSSWTEFGCQLATLHQATQPHFGWSRNNTIGRTPQLNAVSDDWIAFFREYRLRFQIDLALKNGFNLEGGTQLLDSLPQFFNHYTPSPSLLHGDLWSGNAGFDLSGNPFVFDPCCYYGDRETDLAFSEFFGGFPPEFYAAYNETYPLDRGYIRRKTLYNLYHCLNHYNLFGSPYDSQAQRMTHQLLEYR